MMRINKHNLIQPSLKFERDIKPGSIVCTLFHNLDINICFYYAPHGLVSPHRRLVALDSPATSWKYESDTPPQDGYFPFMQILRIVSTPEVPLELPNLQ